MIRQIQVLILITFASLVEAQTYERRLIPLAADATPGAFGTVWNTRVTAVGELPGETELIGFLVTFVPPGVARSQPIPLLVPRSVNEPPGTIAYIPSDVAQTIHLTAIVEERHSREEVAVPVVREDAFANRTGYFMDLTRNASSRLTLRVYSLDLAADDASVRVRIQANIPPYFRPWEFIYDDVHPLTVQQRMMSDYQGTVSLPVRPLALELGLDSLLTNVPEGSELAVSVVPAGELRIWSMLSETNSSTQRVALRYTD